MQTGKHPERQIKLAAARVDLTKVRCPQLVVALRGTTEGILRKGADAFVVGPDGKPIRGDAGMRNALAIAPAVSEISAAEATSGPGCLLTTAGNIKMNGFCLAWEGGNLHYSNQDISRLDSGYRFDACVWWKDSPARVSFERVQFVRGEDPMRWEPLIRGKSVGDIIDLIVSGQRLVERGTPIDPCANANGRAARSYLDKRHEVLNAYTAVRNSRTGNPVTDEKGNPVRRDFGLDQILAAPELLAAAIEGEIVALRLDLFDVDGAYYAVQAADLDTAFEDKSYNKCRSLAELENRQHDGERGLFFIDEQCGCCYQVYQQSPYPLHFVAVRENNTTEFVDGVISGMSNNAPTTLGDLALDLRLSGFKEALLLDNGGDVVMVHRGHNGGRGWPDPNGPCALVPSCLKRTQWAAMLLYRAETEDGVAVRCDTTGTNGTFCVEW